MLNALGVVLRLILVLQIALMGSCFVGNTNGEPVIGRPLFQESMMQDLMFGMTVNMTGGNLLLHRTDFTIDTRLGTQEFGATYNSFSNEWRGSFDMTYDGQLFTDHTGAGWRLDGYEAGQPILGSNWWYVDGTTVRREDGMLFFFANGVLSRMRYSGNEYPQLNVSSSGVEECAIQWGSGLVCHQVAETTATGWVDRAGRIAQALPSGAALPTTVRDPHDVQFGKPGWRYEYNGVGGRLSRITNSEGESVAISYTSTGRVHQIAQEIPGPDPLYTFDFGHDAATDLFWGSVTFPSGGVTAWHYEGSGLLRRRLNADGTETLLEWDSVARVTRVEDNGVVVQIAYPALNQTVGTQANGNVVTMIWDDTAFTRDGTRPLASVVDSLGQVDRRTYNNFGQLEAIYNGEDERTHLYTWGTSGSYVHDLTSLTDQLGRVTGFADYHISGKPESMRFANGAIRDSRTYDLVGNQETGANLSQPGLRRLVYDHDRNVMSSTHAGVRQGAGELYDPQLFATDVGEITQTYRSDGQRLSISRPNGNDTEFAYDERGLVRMRRTRVDGQWQETTFAHDTTSRTMTRENGTEQQVEFDEAGRIESISWLKDGLPESVAIYFYKNGRLDAVVDSERGGQPEKYSYDPVTGETTQIKRLYENTVQDLHYDLRGRVDDVQYREGGVLLRTAGVRFDLAGRQTALLDDQVVIRERIIDATGRLDYETLGTSVVDHTYNDVYPFQRLSTQATNALGAVVVERREIFQEESCETYYQLMCLRTETDIYAGNHVDEAYLEEFYTVGPMFGDVPDIVMGGTFGMRVVRDNGDLWDFDAMNNATRQGVVATWNPEKNRLLSYGTNTYVSDEVGNVIERNGATIEYNAQGLTTHINGKDIEWDARGQLISLDGVGFKFGGAMTNGGVLNIGNSSVNVYTGEQVHRHTDLRGNTAFITDESGDVLQYFRYTAYGVAESGGAGQPRGFAQGYDMGDGVVMLGVRMLDSTTGRFLSPDPVYQLTNQFTYTNGNPIAMWDPLGMEGQPTATDVAVAFGGVGTALIVSGGIFIGASGSIGTAFVTLGLTSFAPQAVAASVVVVGGVAVAGGVIFAVGAAVYLYSAYAAQEAAPSPSTGASRGATLEASSPAFIRRNDGNPNNNIPIVACTPTSLTAVPLPNTAGVALVLLNLALGFVFVRRRRKVRELE